MRMWSSDVAAYQEARYRDPLEQLVGLLYAMRGGVEPKWTLEFNPLGELSERERAEVRMLITQADSLAIADGVLTVEDARTRYTQPGGFAFALQPLEDLAPDVASLGRRSKEAAIDASYLDRAVLLPEQVAESRFGAAGWGPMQPAPEDSRLTDIDKLLAEAGTEAPVVAVAAPASPAPVATEAASVDKDLALNGAQIASALEIVAQVARGDLPRGNGIAMLTEFFSMSPAQAERIMGEVGRSFTAPGNEPAPRADAAPLDRSLLRATIDDLRDAIANGLDLVELLDDLDDIAGEG